MKSVLKEWYSGNLYPTENILCEDPDYKKASAAYRHLAYQLEKELREQGSPLFPDFQEMMDQSVAASALWEEEVFQYGFSLGARIMMEVLTTNLLRFQMATER